ncbi:DUF1614 domain-containing protein [uncultured Gimesia sp.]|uniref:DUF1614 domain-containing protein n=1 Tax=uncultured Gimesia sp. TaxID=1678688 RepID=UPI0030D7A84C
MSTQPPQQFQTPPVSGCMILSLMIFMGCMLPLIFVDLAETALRNLHLSPQAAILVLIGMIFGSLINFPISRFPLDREVNVPVFESLAGMQLMPKMQRLRQEAIIAVNLGGCVIPVLLAIWLSRFIIGGGITPVLVTLVGIALNTVVCYRTPRLVPGMGIAMPVFIPPLVAVIATILGFGIFGPMTGNADMNYQALYAPIAFVIGISGPLIGADLLHWNDFKKLDSPSISIGGAGTWDGIVLSGMIAALIV